MLKINLRRVKQTLFHVFATKTFKNYSFMLCLRKSRFSSCD